MTLPASGALSISQIAVEYGVALPCVFPAAFYGKPGIPAAGALSFSTFYGKSNIVFAPDGGAVSDSGSIVAAVTLYCNAAATWNWALTSGTGNANVGSGSSATSITFTCQARFNGSVFFPRHASFSVTGQVGDVIRIFTVDLDALGTE